MANVRSIEECVNCGARQVKIDMGPHEVEYYVNKELVDTAELVFPVLQCTLCDEGWTDHRADDIIYGHLRRRRGRNG